MPELPEVEALAADLAERLVGRTIRRVQIAEVAALKTYDPPIDALEGAVITGTGRRGKHLVLDVTTADDRALHLVIHLARSGWVRWRDAAPAPLKGRGRGPLAARLVL